MTTGYFLKYLHVGQRAGSVHIGGGVSAAVDIVDLKPAGKQATLRGTCMFKEAVVIDGEAFVLTPSRA